MRSAAMVEELRSLTAMLRDADVDHLVLKGISLVPEYCPDPAIRTQYDHDLLIRAESTGRAEAVLRALK